MLAASTQLPNSEHTRPTPTPQNWCGVIAGMQQARTHVNEGQDQLAINILKEVLEFAPSESEAWNLLATILQKHGMSKKSSICLEKATRFQPASSAEDDVLPASLRLAKLMWAQGDTNSAQQMIATLLESQDADQELLNLQQSWSAQQKEQHP